MPRARFQGEGMELPCPLKAHHPHSTLIFTNSEALQISLFKSFYNPSSASSLPRKSEDGTGSFHTLITWCLVFLVTGAYPKALQGLHLGHFFTVNSGMVTRGQLKKTKDIPITQEIPRTLGALFQKLQTKDQIYFLNYTTVLIML